MTKLHIIHGPNKGSSFELKGPVTYVGRSPENDIQIKHPSVSRRHLKILRKGGKYFVVDLRSTNHTYVDGEFVSPGKEHEVGEGLPITIGKVLISIGEAPGEGTAAGDETMVLPDEFSQTALFAAYRDRPETSIRNLELIYKVSNALVQSLDITELLQKIMDYLFELLTRIDRGVILLVDQKTGELESIASRSKYESEGSDVCYSRTIVRKTLKEASPVVVPDMKQIAPKDFSDSMGVIRSVMCVPLISKSQVLGVVYVDSVDMPHGFRKEDVALLISLSRSAAVAIENALLYSNLEKIAEQKTASLRETEKRLRQSEALFKAIFDNMRSGVCVYKAVKGGKDFVILDINRSGLRIEGVRKKSALGKSVTAVFPQIKETGLFDVLFNVWKSGKPQRRSVTLHDREKVKSWREYYVYRLPSGEVVAIFDDITRRKKAEEEQKALQEQLFISQKMESIGAFAGGTAHNFRNILQAISGNIEYLELIHGKDPQVKEVAKSVYDSVEKGVDLINNLLHFSKRGRELQLSDLNLTDVIMETYRIVEKVFNKRIEIRLNVEQDLPVRGNSSLLAQVFMNLFTNARDAMPEGGTLLVEARKEGEKVVAVVSDTGHGMDRETQSKIFDPFFTLKDVGEGTGLGLSTSLGIIEQHGGAITVSSAPGEGARFEITLPLSRGARPAEQKGEKEIIPGRGERVLIVDDEPPVLEALSNLAKSLGYEPLSVARPADAVTKYRKWSPHVVLMDRNMPEMDGATCIKKIMEIDPEARVVIVSGYEEAGPNGIDEEIKGLIKGYITKPCGREDLSRMLSLVLKG